MPQTMTISKSVFEELLGRISRLERIVFGKNPVIQAIKLYEEEKQSGRLKKLNNPQELFHT